MTPHPLIAQLAAERRRRDLSRTDAAQRAGISERSLRDWENGGMPNLSALQDYLDALGLRLIAIPAGPGEADEPPGEQIPFGQLILSDGEKFCPSCQQVRSRRTDFHRDASRKDGLYARCKTCVSAEYLDRKQRAEQQQRGAA